jgi:hypothetical protein
LKNESSKINESLNEIYLKRSKLTHGERSFHEEGRNNSIDKLKETADKAISVINQLLNDYAICITENHFEKHEEN